MRTVSWAPEWMQRVSRIALYLALIGATILTSTLIAHWLHPR
jgi:tellurite resistance protein TehA-like permease